MSGTLACYVNTRLLAFPWFKDYLSDRKQRVILPEISSDWSKILSWCSSTVYTWA